MVFVLASQGDNWKLLNAVFLETPKAIISELCGKQTTSQGSRTCGNAEESGEEKGGYLAVLMKE